jgi:site-specific DNA-methyltransferase (adenine-specific)
MPNENPATPATPYYQSDRVTLYNADCLAVLPQLAAGSVDAVVTDPPYGTGAWKRSVSGAGGDPRAIHTLETWDVWRTDWLDTAWVKSRGRVLMFCATTNLPSVFDWAGTRPWRLFAWSKSDPRPRFSGQPAYGFECLVAVGGYEKIGGVDWVRASAPRINRDRDGTGHPHQKPIAAAEWACSLASAANALILDPFMGSGTTGVAAIKTGRKFIGIELDAGYCEIAKKRIVEAEEAFATAHAGEIAHAQ